MEHFESSIQHVLQNMFEVYFIIFVFSGQHQKLEDHNCPKAGSLDVRVPVCPLCDQAVPGIRGQPPDIAISQHLDNNCQVKKQKVSGHKEQMAVSVTT